MSEASGCLEKGTDITHGLYLQKKIQRHQDTNTRAKSRILMHGTSVRAIEDSRHTRFKQRGHSDRQIWLSTEKIIPTEP
jgi:hypothetical protein